MGKTGQFKPVKMIAGIIAGEDSMFMKGENCLRSRFGEIDLKSDVFSFAATDYYQKEMGRGLRRRFLSFAELIQPEELSRIKLETNDIEAQMTREEPKLGRQRVINIDPGYVTAAALFMATTKDFAHRVPLRCGIYAHLEILFGKKDIRLLDWTYPDFRTPQYHDFLYRVREIYLKQYGSVAV